MDSPGLKALIELERKQDRERQRKPQAPDMASEITEQQVRAWRSLRSYPPEE